MESAPERRAPKHTTSVLNGTELGGGSLRIYDRELQARMFKALGFTEQRAEEQFGFLLSAFRYGVPAPRRARYGFDRLLVLHDKVPEHSRRICVPQGAERVPTSWPSAPRQSSRSSLRSWGSRWPRRSNPTADKTAPVPWICKANMYGTPPIRTGSRHRLRRQVQHRQTEKPCFTAGLFYALDACFKIKRATALRRRTRPRPVRKSPGGSMRRLPVYGQNA